MDVEALFAKKFGSLHQSHQYQLRKLLVSPYPVAVLDCPGETVYVVAQRGDFVLYWSDIEEGWEWEPLDNGALKCRGSNKFWLSHITHQLFGDPVAE